MILSDTQLLSQGTIVLIDAVAYTELDKPTKNLSVILMLSLTLKNFILVLSYLLIKWEPLYSLLKLSLILKNLAVYKCPLSMDW